MENLWLLLGGLVCLVLLAALLNFWKRDFEVPEIADPTDIDPGDYS